MKSVWRLAPVETARNDARYFRGTGGYHHVLGLHGGTQPARRAHRVRCRRPRRRRRAACAIAAAGGKPSAPAKLTAPGGGYGFGCKDPDGRNLAFVCDAADHADTADKRRPAAQDRPCQSQRPRFRCEPRLLHRRARLSRHRRQRAAVVSALRQHRSLLDRAGARPTSRRSITSPSRCRTSIW